MNEFVDLESLLRWLSSAIGAGTVGWYILTQWVWFQKHSNDLLKRVIGLVAPAPFALLGYLGLILFAYELPPTTWEQAVERAYSVMAAAIVGQLLHGVDKNLEDGLVGTILSKFKK